MKSLALLALIPLASLRADVVVHVDVGHPGVNISPTLYGLMTEEINHSYDGGLYAELIQNRTFQDDNANPVHWSAVAPAGASVKLSLDHANPVNPAALPVSMLATIDTRQGVPAGIANDGFWGIPVKPDTSYQVSFYARGDVKGPLRIAIEGNDGKPIAESEAPAVSGDWRNVSLTLKTPAGIAPSADTRFVITSSSPGKLWLSLVSVFPPTYKDRPNGLRPDLMEKLGAMKPAFLRLPGGNYLEGDTFATRFNWKQTIGPVPERPGHAGCWSYRSSDGLGLMEFLEWCEDLNMEPVLGVFAGYTLKHEVASTPDKLAPFVREGLEELEFVTGPVDSHWGGVRAKLGHPAPFPLHFVEIGNEDLFDRSKSYDTRFAAFYDAIRAKYPKLQIIATTPVKSRKPDLVDDHFYRPARTMERDSTHYDKADRNGPKIFVGEWASMEGSPTPDLNAALGDAAWLTGLERNSDLVLISSYAPLLVNVNPHGWQWRTNLIGYDALRSFGSPSYWVQVMYSNNRGDRVLPVSIDNAPMTAPVEPPKTGGIRFGMSHAAVEITGLHVAGPGAPLLVPGQELARWKTAGGQWKIDGTMLAQSDAGTNDASAVYDAPEWSDYTVEFKVRKTGGDGRAEIGIRSGGDQSQIKLSLAGQKGAPDILALTAGGETKNLFRQAGPWLEPDKWHDVRIEASGPHIVVAIDGAQLCDKQATPDDPVRSVYATASRDDATGDVIIKAVNTAGAALETRIALEGVPKVGSPGKAIVLSGTNPLDQNTLDEPGKVKPVDSPLNVERPVFNHALPAFSVSVLRIPVAKNPGLE